MITLTAEELLKNEVLGLPLKEAVCLIEQAGLECEIINYRSLRGVEGANDSRVLRCDIYGGCAHVVVSEFLTEI